MPKTIKNSVQITVTLVVVDAAHKKMSHCKQNMLKNRHGESKEKKRRNKSRRLPSLKLLAMGTKLSNKYRKNSVI